MVDYTESLRLELQDTGTNRSIWGGKANNNFSLIEKGVTGFKTIAMTDANYTLSTEDAAEDEARYFMLEFTGTLTQSRSIIIPQVSKTYLINNNTTGGYDLSISNGINSVTASNGGWTYVWTNGSAMYRRIGTPLYTQTDHGGSPAITSGYQSLGNGLIMQWLTRASSGQNTSFVLNWETAFGATPFTALASGADVWVSAVTATTVTVSTGGDGGGLINVWGVGPE